MTTVQKPFVPSPELKRLERKVLMRIRIYNNAQDQLNYDYSTSGEVRALIALDNARDEYMVLERQEKEAWMNSQQ
jgi:hypothetical protein